MANPHISYEVFKSRFGDLGITEWTKYNYLSNYNFGLPAQTEVPTDKYLELEYIQSSGTQYIDLGVKGNEKSYAEIDAINKDIALSGNRLFGARTSAQEPDAMFFSTNIFQGVTQDYYQFGASGYNLRDTSATRRMYNIGKDDVDPFETPDTLLLFNGYTQGSPSQGYWQVFSCKFYQDNVLIYNFKPVKRLSDGAIGMYDTVTNSFFGNAGTGSFTAGPMKQRYVRVEYVGFDGDSFLNTGIVPTATMEFDAEYKLDEVPATETYRWIIGSYTNEDSNTTRILLYGGNTTYAGILSKAAGGSIQASIRRNTTTWYKDRIYRQGNLQVYESNGQRYTKERAEGATSSATLRIGLIGDSSGTSAKFKLKTLCILDNGQLIHNYVPVYDLALEEYGLYDLVKGKFYNANRGDLTGPWDFFYLGHDWTASQSTPHGYWMAREYAPNYDRAKLDQFWLINANGYKYIGGVHTGSVDCQDHEFAVQVTTITNEFYVRDNTANTTTDIANHLSGTYLAYHAA